MIRQNWWYTALPGPIRPCPPLRERIACDVLVVGGGMSGMNAVLELLGRGLSVVLLESRFIGGGSTGRSAGFLTPDSELELHQLVRRFGPDGARTIWEAPSSGVDRLLEGIRRHGIECDLESQDSLFLGIGRSGRKDVLEEARARERVGYGNHEVYDQATLTGILGGSGYKEGLRYGGTWVMSALGCAQELKRVFLDAGVRIFESSPVIRIDDHTAHTSSGSVTAQQIVVAIDKPGPAVVPQAGQIQPLRTYLCISEPLSAAQQGELFPDGRRKQCWDSKLIYSYFRLTSDDRLLLGGGSAISSYLRQTEGPGVIEGVIKEFKSHFPFLSGLPFVQYWPGLIDTTRDLLPIIARPDAHPHLHFILGIVGLPWAAFAGSFAARNATGEPGPNDEQYYRYFSPHRHFVLPLGLARLIGKPLLYSLTSTWSKYHQVEPGTA